MIVSKEIPFKAIKGDFAHKMGDCLSNDGFIKFIPEYAPEYSEKVLILGRTGFGVLSTIQDDESIESKGVI